MRVVVRLLGRTAFFSEREVGMKASQIVFAGLGASLLPVALAGLVLPLLPGTPLLILSAFCFARASPQLEAWLVNHRRLGPPIQEWRIHGAIPWSTKMVATAAIGSSFAWMLASNAPLAGKIIAALVMLAATGFIWSRPDA
tara:strand:- start:977 stop:1399 length:423 start_codon:yes stop_codon:yes gene_type:complete